MEPIYLNEKKFNIFKILKKNNILFPTPFSFQSGMSSFKAIGSIHAP